MRPPKFELEDVEDYYTYYVLLLEIPEDVFWEADCAFVREVAENKAAFDGWQNYVMDKEREKAKQRAKRKGRR